MTLWICWSIVASALIAGAAAALDSAAPLVGIPRRAVWMTAIVAALVAPAPFAARYAPSTLGSESTLRAGPIVSSSVNASASVARTTGSNLPIGQSIASTSSAERLPFTLYAKRAAAWSSIGDRVDVWVVRAWLAASLFLASLLAIAVIRLRLDRSGWSAADTEIGRVDVAADVGPAVIGVFRPRIVLPRWALALESDARALMLRHELEHLRAGDTRTLFASQLALVVFPWNLPLRWMMRRLRLAIEMDCDARVIRGFADAHTYASMLLAVGERYVAGPPLATPLLESRLELEARVDAIAAMHRPRSRAACVPLLAVAAIALATVAWTPRPAPLLGARAASPGVRFRIELPDAGARTANMFTTFAGTVEYSSGRGRIDVADVAAPSPHSLNGVTVGPILARPGDYYLFDSTGYVLVRPASRTFSRVSFTTSTYRHGNVRAPWDGYFPFTDVKSQDIAPSDRRRLTQHGPFGVRWHLDRLDPSGQTSEILARGRTLVADAPRGEASVVRWMDVTAALATLRDSVPVDSNMKLTAVAMLPATSAMPEANIASIQYMSDLGSADIDPARLAVPAGYTETPLPGFEHASRVAARPIDSAADSQAVGRTRADARALARNDTVKRDPIIIVDGVRVPQHADSVLAAVGYAERKQRGGGFFIDGAQIDRDATSFSEILRVLPAVGNSSSAMSSDRPQLTIRRKGNAQSYTLVDSRDASGCVEMFVDGSRLEPADAQDIDQMVRPSTLIAIEAYGPSEAPPQFATQEGDGCETIIAWTRGWRKIRQ